MISEEIRVTDVRKLRREVWEREEMRQWWVRRRWRPVTDLLLAEFSQFSSVPNIQFDLPAPFRVCLRLIGSFLRSTNTFCCWEPTGNTPGKAWTLSSCLSGATWSCTDQKFQSSTWPKNKIKATEVYLQFYFDHSKKKKTCLPYMLEKCMSVLLIKFSEFEQQMTYQRPLM